MHTGATCTPTQHNRTRGAWHIQSASSPCQRQQSAWVAEMAWRPEEAGGRGHAVGAHLRPSGGRGAQVDAWAGLEVGAAAAHERAAVLHAEAQRDGAFVVVHAQFVHHAAQVVHPQREAVLQRVPRGRRLQPDVRLALPDGMAHQTRASVLVQHVERAVIRPPVVELPRILQPTILLPVRQVKVPIAGNLDALSDSVVVAREANRAAPRHHLRRADTGDLYDSRTCK